MTTVIQKSLRGVTVETQENHEVRIFKAVLDALGIHGAFTEHALIARVQSIAAAAAAPTVASDIANGKARAFVWLLGQSTVPISLVGPGTLEIMAAWRELARTGGVLRVLPPAPDQGEG